MTQVTDWVVQCSKCWEVFTEAPALECCPHCGNEKMVFYRNGVERSLQRALRFSTHSDEGEKKERITTLGNTFDGKTFDYDVELLPGNMVKIRACDQVYQGEHAVKESCQLLLDRRSSDVASCTGLEDVTTQPSFGPPTTDCIALEGDRRIFISHTRAIHNEQYWAALNTTGLVQVETTVGTVAEEMHNAIRRKKEDTKPRERRMLLLLLDARQSPQALLPSVIKAFRTQHGAWLRNLEYREVWLGGWDVNLQYRLDVP